MKKRKKAEQVEIQRTELMPTTIGVIDTKESGPLFAIIWIIIFALGIFFLPTISDYLSGNKNIENQQDIPSKPTTPTPSTPVDDSREEELYSYNDNLSFEIEGFQFSNFSLTNESIQFQITNESASSSNEFLNHNYYLELYSKEKSLLQRIKLKKESITKNRTYEYSLNTNAKDISFLSVVLKEEKDYPPVSLKEDKTGLGTLTCKKDEETIVYSFLDEELTTIEETVTVEETAENYEEKYDEYSILSETYEPILKSENVSFTPTNIGFRFQTTIDLETINKTNYKQYFTKIIYYPYQTNPKVVSFELQSSGYSCEM